MIARYIENITTWLKDILMWLEEAKNVQPQRSNIRTYVKRSAQWAGQATIPNQTGYSRSAFFTVTAVAKNQPYLYADCSPELRRSPTGNVYTARDEFNAMWESFDTGSDANMFAFSREMSEVKTTDPKVKQWGMYVHAPVGATFYMNFVVTSTDDVEITVAKR